MEEVLSTCPVGEAAIYCIANGECMKSYKPQINMKSYAALSSNLVYLFECETSECVLRLFFFKSLYET